jgi:hypothetical protein
MQRGSILKNTHREGGVIENHSGSKWDYTYIWDYGIMMGRIWFFHSLPFRRNGIVHTLPRSRMSRKCLQSRRYSVQEEWYSTHASQKKDEQEAFTKSSLFITRNTISCNKRKPFLIYDLHRIPSKFLYK